MAARVCYTVESHRRAREVLAAVARRFRSRRATSARSEVYFDTFDWRLHRHGSRLTATADDGMQVLNFERTRDELSLRARVASVPSFASEMPPASGLREVLKPIIEVRRLFPTVRVETDRRLLEVLGDDDKVVARLAAERQVVRDPGDSDRRKPLPPMLVAESIRGYEHEFGELVDHLETALELERSTSAIPHAALDAIGRRPRLTSRLQLALEADLPAAEVLRRLHLALLATIEVNEEGARRDLDSEFLHDFRVAVRRTRGALALAREIYAPDVVEHFRAEFAWLGRATGRTRDLDVYLLAMPDFRTALPERCRGDLGPLVVFLRRQLGESRRRMVADLDSDRYRELLRGWRRFLERRAASSTGAQATAPIGPLASRWIWRRYRRVERRGRAIGAESPASALHELRIECKKLRYLLEFFRSLYSSDGGDRLIRALRRLQENLGAHQDSEIQRLELERFARAMFEDGNVPVTALLTTGRLLERLEERQAAERRRFDDCFARFTAKKHRRAFRRLFKRSRGRS